MGLRKATKPLFWGRFVVGNEVKVAPSNKTTNKSTTRAPKCFRPIGATPEELQEAFLGAPTASQEGPPGSQKGNKTQWIFNELWFGSKSRWHQATRLTRTAARGPKGPMATFEHRTFGRLRPQEAPNLGPKASLEERCGAQTSYEN